MGELRESNHKRIKLSRRVESLHEILDVKRWRLMQDDVCNLLSDSFSGTALELLKRMVEGSSRVQYTAPLRAFALTLHFYSPKAYQYVRETFDICLLHERTIRKWLQTVDGTPGFISQFFLHT